MFCYKDKTFCLFYMECVEGAACDRALTPAVVHEAKRHQLPVSEFMHKPDCFVLREKGMKDEA